MADIDLGPRCLLAKDMLRAETDEPLDNAVLFVELHPGVLTCEMFQDLGDHIVYREVSEELEDYIWGEWDDEVPRRRWQVMLLHLQNRDSETIMIPASRLDTRESLIDRCERFVRQTLGDKPIIYPSWPRQED